MEDFFSKSVSGIKNVFGGLFKQREKQPKPGYKFIEGTNIQAPINSDLHPENRAGYKPEATFSEPEIKPLKEEKPEIKPFEGMFIRGRIPETEKMKISDRVEGAIRKAADTYKLPPEILYDIAFSESSFGSDKRNPEGTATGLFQFTDGTWETVKRYAKMQGSTLKLPNYDRNDPETNALAAAYLIKNGQLGRWDASKWNWGKHYNQEEIEPYYSQTIR